MMYDVLRGIRAPLFFDFFFGFGFLDVLFRSMEGRFAVLQFLSLFLGRLVAFFCFLFDLHPFFEGLTGHTRADLFGGFVSGGSSVLKGFGNVTRPFTTDLAAFLLTFFRSLSLDFEHFFELVDELTGRFLPLTVELDNSLALFEFVLELHIANRHFDFRPVEKAYYQRHRVENDVGDW